MAWLFNLDTLNNWAYIHNVFSPDECNKIIQIASLKEKKDAVIIGKDNPGELNKDVRKNKVVWLDEQDDLDWAYRKMTDAITYLNAQFFNFDLYGFTEQLQFTEYNAPGDNYKLHIDRSFNGVIRKLSIVIQLTNPDEYEGCDLEIHDSLEPIKLKRDQGTMLAFPSFTLHKVTPITKGTRHSLVAWIGGPNFK